MQLLPGSLTFLKPFGAVALNDRNVADILKRHSCTLPHISRNDITMVRNGTKLPPRLDCEKQGLKTLIRLSF
jgi:hypothetical protein